MYRTLRRYCAIAAVAAPMAVAAQEPPAVPPDTARRPDSAPAVRAEPTADQQKYLRGVRTAARGVAQLRTGVDGVARAEGRKDPARLTRAGRMLAGLCGTARNFMAQGRSGMSPVVYEDSARVRARRLTLQVDSLIKAMPPCETDAAKAPTRVAADLLARLRSYETALQDFRVFVLGATPPVSTPPPAPGSQHN